MTIDLEDWYHSQSFANVFQKTEWTSLASRIEYTADLLLGLLDKHKVKATFFVLGDIASRYPEIIKRIHAAQHEIASHGNKHDLIYHLTHQEFRKDIKEAKRIIEDVIMDRIYGYRAPNFSITEWAIDIIQEEGYKYDSSYYPVFFHDRYGKLNVQAGDQKYFFVRDDLIEVPLSSLPFFNLQVPWSGGGYFRLLPFNLYRKGVNRIMRQKKFFMFYIHPWEFDPGQPIIKNMKKSDRFRHYNNLDKTLDRFIQIISEFSFTTVKDFLREQGVMI